MAVLEDAEIARRLSALPGWSREGDAIVKRYEFPSFAEAIAFVSRIAARAEMLNHHPDFAIHYRVVTLSLWTHSEGGITEKDMAAAAEFDEAVG
ncbi:MAG: 4a-hydroxytetrahydrobiopterin dehydratase [Gemmatimonadota bacterium]|nr:MAG: 4a-hydroxytetrahydrobiopterin dehydratase [Gemmatimonadota bacterium]